MDEEEGAAIVGKVFLAVFPTDHVLKKFLEESHEGDLLFMHHPLLMECGDSQDDGVYLGNNHFPNRRIPFSLGIFGEESFDEKLV